MTSYRTNIIDENDMVNRVEIHPNTNSNILTVNSKSRTGGGYSKSLYEASLLLKGNTNKLGIYKYFVDYLIPVINEKNNIIRISNGSGEENITLINGHYSISNLMSHLQTRLTANSLGIVFTFSAVTDSPLYILTTNIPFRFLPSSHIERSEPSTGLYSTGSLISSMLINPKGLYTSYLDFIIPQLRDGANNSNVFTEAIKFNSGNHFLRVYYYNYGKEIELKNILFHDVKKRKISTIEVDIIDQFGESVFDDGFDYVEYIMEITTST